MSEASSDDECYGPAPPPGQPKVIGPQLPSSFTNKAETGQSTSPVIKKPIASPVETQPTAAVESEDDDDNDIGPYPTDDPRSQRVPKARLPELKPDLAPKREEWMLVPPKNKSISEIVGLVGLAPRKFLGRTPDEIELPEEEQDDEPDFHEQAKAELQEKSEKERDAKMEEMLKEASSKKGKETLLSLHRKRKKEEDEGPKERRPFDRDEDLKVGGLSAAEREKFIKKTSELGSRFHGGKRKFL